MTKKSEQSSALILDTIRLKKGETLFLDIKETGNYLRIFYEGIPTDFKVERGEKNKYVSMIEFFLKRLQLPYPSFSLEGIESVLKIVLKLQKVETVNNRKIKTIILTK